MHVGVVGGGIVGLAVARELALGRPGLEVTVLEKELAVGRHQTSHNSGVVHAGVYYPPGSLKALLCRRGVGLLREFCAEHRLPYAEVGKLVVALTEAELPGLRAIHDRAQRNGVPGVRLLDPAGLREVEPHATGLAAVHSPTTAITDFAAVAEALAAEVRRLGGMVEVGFAVTALAVDGPGVVASGPAGRRRFDRLVNCAGLHADRVARLAGDLADPMIVPFRGEYHRLVPERRHLVRGLIYPVPDPRYPFLGVHLTRRVDGEVDLGPNAVLALAREGYRWRDLSGADLREAAGWPGTRALVRRHWRTGVQEVVQSLSTGAFVRSAARYVPALGVADVVPGPSGVRAQAVARDGTLVDDFRLSRTGPVVSLRNAPSPAATSALAIAEHLVGEVLG